MSLKLQLAQQGATQLKIAVYRTLQLGDMLCIIPAMRALRNAYPHAHITLLGLPWAESFVERFHQYFDEFVHCPGLPGLPEQPFDAAKTARFFLDFQQQGYDLLLQMQGNGTVINPMMEFFGARQLGGFYTPGDYAPNLDYFMPYPNEGPEPERHIQLMEFLGISSQGNALEFRVTPSDEAEYAALNLPIQPQQYVCIHPGSRGAWRQWPTQHFAALADYAAEQGYQPVITGTAGEQPIIDEVMGYMKHQAINTAGITTLGAVGVLIKNARALISNCTGVSHMASAFKTPSVVISMDGEPGRWAPIDKETHLTIDWTKTPDYNLVFEVAVKVLSR
ncbi:glycosyltransferase family 9 protein [Mucilaginibacter koreensis]